MAPPESSKPTSTAACIVSVDPLVTISKRQRGLPVGLATLEPARFADPPSVNFVGQTWSIDAKEADIIAHDVTEARRVLPRAKFVFLANTPDESTGLAAVGVPALLANELIFVDERVFTPAAPASRRAPACDAVYVGKLAPYKRHELAKSVQSLLLVYGSADLADVERVRAHLPSARFANHEANGGAYKAFDGKAVRDLMVQCAVGLCLSAVEGSMRASLEYRLCGLPVVSTRSDGGRDRYLLGPHVRVVDDKADAVAAAVRELKHKAFDPIAVREHVGRLVAFDRHNFLLNANKIVERELGARARFNSFAPFLHHPVVWRPVEQILVALDRQRA